MDSRDVDRYKSENYHEIQEAHLPDVVVNMTAIIPFSFVNMLQNMVNQVIAGEMKTSSFYQSLDNMENTIEFFRNITALKRE